MSPLAVACAASCSVVFGASVFEKLGTEAFRAFVATAGPLRVIPDGMRSPAAIVAVVAEGVVTAATGGYVLLALMGERIAGLATLGFAAAIFLVAAFTAAIALSIARGERTPCRCFGPSTTPMGMRHIVRNCLLGAIPITGVAADVEPPTPIDLPFVLLASIAGTVVAVLVMRFDDIVELFRATAPGGVHVQRK